MKKFEPVTSLVAMVAAPLLWAAHFMLVYAGESLLCRAASPAGHSFLVVVATLAASLAVLYGLGPGRRRAAGFHSRVEAGLGVLSLTGILWTGIAGLMLAACR